MFEHILTILIRDNQNAEVQPLSLIIRKYRRDALEVGEGDIERIMALLPYITYNNFQIVLGVIYDKLNNEFEVTMQKMR